MGKATTEADARELLVRMLACLGEFRHLRLDEAHLQTRRTTLFDVFIAHFLDAVEVLVRQGLRGGYSCIQDDLLALRGKLILSRHLRLNLARRDRFSVEHDQFTHDRVENRLIVTALSRVGASTSSMARKRQAHQLTMAFDGVPLSNDVVRDLSMTRVERDMHRYEVPLAWSRLILNHLSPLTGAGDHLAPSLLFPVEALFEAYVARHFAQQLPAGYRLKAQASSRYLTTHNGQSWFRLKPDLLVLKDDATFAVLDTKWKLLDERQNDARQKYGLSQNDFYQLFAYGHHYLDGQGTVLLVYPRTETFTQPLAPFRFTQAPNLWLLVVPFCWQSRQVILPVPVADGLFGASNLVW
jgi:5-methylcytosine-specific restriction enzyme subunit McrC